MSGQKYMPRLEPIAKNPLIAAAFDITEKVYDVLPVLPAEEKWDTGSKLRQASNNLLYDIAKGIANAAPNAGEFDWSNARKDAAGLLTMYRFAIEREFLDKNTDLLLKLNELIRLIDVEILETYKRSEAYNRYEMSLWQEKYDMWKKLNKELAK